MKYIAEIDKSGRILIPAILRKELDLHHGYKVVINNNKGSLSLSKRTTELHNAQQKFQKLFNESEDNLVDEFLSFRKN